VFPIAEAVHELDRADRQDLEIGTGSGPHPDPHQAVHGQTDHYSAPSPHLIVPGHLEAVALTSFIRAVSTVAGGCHGCPSEVAPVPAREWTLRVWANELKP
jgi:hypothetical protein